MGEIWIWCGDLHPQFQREYTSLIAKARELSQGYRVCAVVASCESPAGNPCLSGADQILWFKAEGSCLYQGEMLCSLARQRQPEIILLSATLQGAQVASRVAARLEAGLSADCTDLWMDNGLLVMHRPAFGGGVEADILCPNAKPQMATVRPGVFSHLAPVSGEPQLVELPLPQVAEDPVKLLETSLSQMSESISDAKNNKTTFYNILGLKGCTDIYTRLYNSAIRDIDLLPIGLNSVKKIILDMRNRRR